MLVLKVVFPNALMLIQVGGFFIDKCVSKR